MSLWTVERVEFRRRELDFTSSGQGRRFVTSLVADGTEIINALELFDTELAARIPLFADPNRWPALTMRESVLLLQWDAPARVLGEFPGKPRLRQEAISAASHGTGHETYAALEMAVEQSWADARPVRLVSGEPVAFYMEEAGSPEWMPLTFDGDKYRLALETGVGVEPV